MNWIYHFAFCLVLNTSMCYNLRRMETLDTTQGARRKGDASLPVQYANEGGADSADGGNTSNWQNCGIIPATIKYLHHNPSFF